MKTIYAISGIIFLVLFSSCSSLRIEKRHYRGGYYVDFVSGKTSDADRTQSKTSEIAENPEVVTTAGITVTSPAAPEQQFAGPSAAPVVMDSENKTERTAPTPTKGPEHNVPAPAGDKTDAHIDHPADDNSHPETDTMLIIEVILCFLIPPLAIYLKEGITTRFWIDLICFLFVALFFTPFRYGSALWLFAVIFALLIILDVI